MTIAIVTGASRGIGRAIALQLAEDGMDLNDIQAQSADLENVRKEVEKKGRRATCVIADVTQESEVQEMVAAVVKEFGELNVMVANAGILVAKSLFEVSVDEWDKVMAVNVRGVMLCYREAAKQMIKQGKGGKIVGACSTAGHRPSGGGVIAYGTSKWAVRGLTQATAMELGQHNINVNAYCPGPVPTDMWDKIAQSVSEHTGVTPEEAFNNSVNTRTALKRHSEPEDIANLVSFLVSPKARNITGQSVLTDGGIAFA
ncbi:hypothetical protein PV05_11833 [Exophiala xenobiotica]|uniref:Diacetyl reductase [(S)-acetoin forming] n=1 Tax=Exophiala xenobiotica TaxID=348802 RepID=A0A0D2ER20_9EURO|nr:uncharacterized protein PV05_11833 [Exophiala xenobiotica]KIW50224.1 hypothetical protein PV05_11833 [Exophiala xenobiotica]